MNSRRKFLIRGSLATTAMLALKPFTALARMTSAFTGPGNLSGQLILLHTANIEGELHEQAIQYITRIKNNNANAILLKAGSTTPNDKDQLSYDAVITGDSHLSAISGDYKIITKGNIKIGFISAKPVEADVIQKVNGLAAYLKNKKNCTIVVCLSQLGYKNKNTPDDMTLARQSADLDIIIGGHTDNFQQNPVIALNSNNREVIIHSAAGNAAAVGKIEIGFDEQGRKNHVNFINPLSINKAKKQTVLVA